MSNESWQYMLDARANLTNPNGCPLPMTWFAMRYHSQCDKGACFF